MKEVRYNGDLIKDLQTPNSGEKRNLKMYALKGGLVFITPYALSFFGSNIGTEKFKMFSYAAYTILRDPFCTILMLSVAGTVVLKQEMKHQDDNEKINKLKEKLDIKRLKNVDVIEKKNGHSKEKISGAIIESVNKDNRLTQLFALKDNIENNYHVFMPETKEEEKIIKEYKLVK